MTARATPSKARIVVVLGVLVGFFIVGKYTGWTDSLRVERVRALVARAGPAGYLLFAGVFAAGELIHVPGTLFVAAGVLAFGKKAGFVAGLAGALISVSVTFFIVRTLGGRALTGVEHPYMKRILAHLDAHPLRTVILLRLAFWMAPPVNYALALSNIRFRHYLAGSALGLFAPIALIVIFVERFLRWFALT